MKVAFAHFWILSLLFGSLLASRGEGMPRGLKGMGGKGKGKNVFGMSSKGKSSKDPSSKDTSHKSTKGKGKKGMSMKGMGMNVSSTKPSRRPDKPTIPRRTKALFVVENSIDLEVLKCDATTVEVQGNYARNLTPGTALIYLQSGMVGCLACSPLLRLVESVQAPSAWNVTAVLKTRFLTAGEVLDGRAAEDIQNTPLESLAGCSHSMTSTTAKSAYASKIQSLPEASPSSLEAEESVCAVSWLKTNSDGRCSYTNCFVGTSGDPNDCFVCHTACDKGCGAGGAILNSDGNFSSYDFSSSCCNHNYCWSSTFSKFTCNSGFHDEMTAQCAPLNVSLVAIDLPLAREAPSATCLVAAAAFFLAVNVPGVADAAHQLAQAEQKSYEKEPVCVARCPSAQESGGQGLTVLTIDLIVPSGTFPVSYEMYPNPDQLYIDYEGQRIFDTGGLVSGSGSVDVAYAGTTSVIQVTINAPNSGTLWDVAVGCPYSVSL